MRNQVWSVSTLVRYLKNSLDNDIHIQSILIKGEISNLTNHRSGHMYFSIKDENAKMNCVMFASNVRKLKIQPKVGMKVIVNAKVSLYEPQGSIQLYVTNIQSDGIGDLYLQFEALKRKLYNEGLFADEHKKTIPEFPKSIGVISARTGAAIQDVLSIISRRWPVCEVKLYPSLVQGENAYQDIIQRLLEADQNNHDIILLVRGGGSIEDLWCFNNEQLARVIYDMKTCIITGVGHETDTTLVDYVSDYRAPTPSGAAEVATPDINELKEDIYHLKSRLQTSMYSILNTNKQLLNTYKKNPYLSSQDAILHDDKYKLEIYKKVLYNVDYFIESNTKDIEVYKQQIIKNMNSLLNNNKENMKQNIILLDAYSPLKILERGYSITMKDNTVIQSIKDVSEDENIDILVNDGKIHAKVTGKD